MFFAIVRSAILCLRGSRSRRRQLGFADSDLQIKCKFKFSKIKGSFLINSFSSELTVNRILIVSFFFFSFHLYFIRDMLLFEQANVNIESRRFGVIMTPFSRQSDSVAKIGFL